MLISGTYPELQSLSKLRLTLPDQDENSGMFDQNKKI